MNERMPESCDARIRMMRPVNEVEIVCDRDPHGTDIDHRGQLRDYAYPGSVTTVDWAENDRRTFRGEFTVCVVQKACSLPSGHGGRCIR